jgi:hypothetical protein
MHIHRDAGTPPASIVWRVFDSISPLGCTPMPVAGSCTCDKRRRTPENSVSERPYRLTALHWRCRNRSFPASGHFYAKGVFARSSRQAKSTITETRE